jgi:hypothetical protein
MATKTKPQEQQRLGNIVPGPGFKFIPARRENINLFVGLAGGTGSGKTKSALRLARGIVGPNGRIAAGDTEGRRMSYYAGHDKFDVTDIEPPFEPPIFRRLAEDAEAAKYDCLIIDSMSHEWAGDGGVLEWHEHELDRFVAAALAREPDADEEKVRNAQNMRAWIKPKSAHKSMINSFLQRRIPIIFCFRAEERVKPTTGGGVQNLGWQPIGDQRFMFELTTMITLGNDEPGVVNYKLPRKIHEDHLGYFPDGVQISERAGEYLAMWAKGAPDKITQAVTDLLKRVKEQDTIAKVDAIMAEDKVQKQVKWLSENRKAEHKRLFDVTNAWRVHLRAGGTVGAEPRAGEEGKLD